MKFANKIILSAALVVGYTLTGCLNDSGSTDGTDARLMIQAGVKDVNKVNSLGKTSVITFKKLIITMKSNVGTDTVIRDTILANDSANSKFKTSATSDQIFAKSYSVTPLRTWTVVVKTLDLNDSVIHYDSVVAAALLAGETRPVELTLKSRFVMYEAKFSLPDSLNFTAINLKQQLKINRVLMIVDGDTVADSSSASRFAVSPKVHSLRFDYINVNETPDVAIEFFGRLGDDTTTTKLFKYLFENVSPTETSPDAVQADYTGPKSSDLASFTGLTINIGKVGTVVFTPVIDSNVTGKAAATP